MRGAKIHNLMLFFTLDFDHTYEFVFIHLARNEATNAITCHFLQQYCHFLRTTRKYPLFGHFFSHTYYTL